MSQVLDAYGLPLFGSRLIEASAGTGKTWTIASLYLRLVLGHGEAGDPGTGFRKALMPSEILVMTFTRAATRELSDRIRNRLIEAARCFRGDLTPAADDLFLQRLMAFYADSGLRERAAWQLASAAEAMDECAVFTIDAWCQRMLSEHAFDTGNALDEALIADQRTLLREAAHDTWRQHCYPLSGQALGRLLAVYPDVDALVDEAAKLLAERPPWTIDDLSLAHCIDRAADAHARALATLSQGWVERAESMRAWLDWQTSEFGTHWNLQRLRPANYRRWLDAIVAWARAPYARKIELTAEAQQRLSPEGLLAIRQPGAPPVELHEGFEALGELLRAIARLPSPHTPIRMFLTAQVGERLSVLKARTRSFGFADIVARLEHALSGPQGGSLRHSILSRYPVALIDEFQDTSPEQYRLFDALYRCAENDPDHALLLIGDPKQSIYRFRGADIYSYLRARAATEGRHYALDTNHRSTQDLVAAVNSWFERAEHRDTAASGQTVLSPAQPALSGAFLFHDGHHNPMPFEPVRAKGRPDRLVTTAGAVAPITIEHDLTVRSGEASRARLAARCAERIVGWLNDDRAGFQDTARAFTRLRPKDIAVLVRTGTEADAVRSELRRRGVASVYLSERDSVFATGEANDLLRWLRAVAAPSNAALVRSALATATIGLSLSELEQLASDDETFDLRCEQLRLLRAVWNERGVLAMLRKMLHDFSLPERWRLLADWERRLTNLLHLAELLQQASTELDGEQALIRWLGSRIADTESTASDEHLLRLESDADLIRVVTIHKSKGLEYPLVCLPFACSVKRVSRQGTRFVVQAGEVGERELKLDFDEDDIAQADLERLREDLRLFYVALTRARHALWLGFGLLKFGNTAQCTTHHSAAGRLLGGPEPRDATGWLAQLQTLAHDAHERFRTRIALEAMPEVGECSMLAAPVDSLPLGERAPYAASFERHWSPGSYSLLARDLDSAAFAPATHRSRAADEEEGLPEPTLPQSVPANLAPWHRLPGGAAAGDFIHGLLEWLDREGFSLADNTALQLQLATRCERSGWGNWYELVQRWLLALLQTRLPILGASLPELQVRLPEMEFWMPATDLRATEVDAFCQQALLGSLARPELPPRQLNGMLMGFADLVFEHQGRYWVLDYKTNRVGPDGYAYDRDALESEMARHRYDVQAALYLLALHRLLRTRLGSAYQPEQHLGGALFWFIRGLDGPVSGEYAIPADGQVLRLIGQLDALFESAAESW